MRQWVEIQEEQGEGDNKRTVYRYEMRWCESEQKTPNDSGGQHNNPDMPVKGNESPAEASPAGGTLGAYYCGDFVRKELRNWADKTITAADLEHATLTGWFASFESPKPINNWWYYQKKGRAKKLW